MPKPKMSYRDFLVLQAARAAGALNEAVAIAMDASDEYAITYLERRLDTLPELARYQNPNPARVEPRPNA